MGLRDAVSKVLSAVQENRRVTEPNSHDRSPYPICDRDFVHNLTWRCDSCDEEFYWFESDDRLTCHRCDTQYTLSSDDFPELLQAKCWNCGRISEEVSGFRAENISFDCPYCDFAWESDPY